jgi:restriction endonuclease Mrr
LDLIYPTLRAVATLGGSAQGKEITAQVLDDLDASEEQLAVTYENRPKSVLVDRLEWARSYAKLGGALDSPQRGLYVLTAHGKEILGLPENDARKKVTELDRAVKAARAQNQQSVPDTSGRRSGRRYGLARRAPRTPAPTHSRWFREVCAVSPSSLRS